MLAALGRQADRIVIGTRGGRMRGNQLRQAVLGLARRVQEAEAGELVFLGTHSPAFPVVLLGGVVAGVPVVPLNYRLPADSVRAILRRRRRPFVVADEEFLDVMAEDAHAVTASADMVAEAMRSQPGAVAGTIPDSAVVVLHTSGTTSEPKAVVLRQRHVQAAMQRSRDSDAASEDETVLLSPPPYHVGGVLPTITGIETGKRLVYLDTFDPAEWLRLIRTEHVTSASLVPTMMARVVTHLNGRPADVPSLRTLNYGGSATSPSVLRKALLLFEDTGFVHAYGSTETAGPVAVLGPEEHRAALRAANASDDPRAQERLCRLRLLPGISAQVREPGGQGKPNGEVGELYVRGAQVSGEYVDSGSALDDEGWYAMGDLAHIDSEGYLFVHGRVDDTIIRGGENIAPYEVEDVLMAHPAVEQAAVIGTPDTEWGNRIVAVVVGTPGADIDESDVRAWVRASLRSMKTPDRVLVHDALPYSEAGKLLRHKLREQVLEGMGT